MVESFLIHRSRQAVRALLSSTLFGTAVIAVWLQPPWFAALAAALPALLAWRQYRLWQRTPALRLSVDPSREIIALEQGGQTHFFDKYKVYPSRWFAILKLIKPRKTRVMLLLPDRFESDRAYRDCRFNLRQLERRRAA